MPTIPVQRSTRQAFANSLPEKAGKEAHRPPRWAERDTGPRSDQVTKGHSALKGNSSLDSRCVGPIGFWLERDFKTSRGKAENRQEKQTPKSLCFLNQKLCPWIPSFNLKMHLNEKDGRGPGSHGLPPALPSLGVPLFLGPSPNPPPLPPLAQVLC